MSDYTLQHPLTPEQEALYHQSRQPALFATLITLLILSDSVIVSRLWINVKRHWKTKGLLIEDVCIFIGGILLTVVFATLIDATRYGLGLHTWRINAEDPNYPENLAHVFRDCWITMVLMCAFFLSVKFSLLFFYRRLFIVTNKWLKIAWWANLVYIVLWFIGGTAFYLFQCWPVEWYWLQYYARWDKVVPGGALGECGARSPKHVAMPMSFSLVSDVALLTLPLGAISSLKVSKKRKIGLLSIFGVGVVACLLELARILQMSLDTDDSKDPSYGVAIFVILTASEETAAVVCACLPVIVAHLGQVVKERSNSAKSGSGGVTGGNSQSRRGANLYNRISSFGRNRAASDVETLASPVSPSKVYFSKPNIQNSRMDLYQHSGDSHSNSTSQDENDSTIGEIHSLEPLNTPMVTRDIRIQTDIQVDVAKSSANRTA